MHERGDLPVEPGSQGSVRSSGRGRKGICIGLNRLHARHLLCIVEGGAELIQYCWENLGVRQA